MKTGERNTATAGDWKIYRIMENKDFTFENEMIESGTDRKRIMDQAAETAEIEGKAEEAEQQEKSGNAMTEILSWIRDIAVAVILAILISQFITPTIVQEHSMDDTLHNNDYLILWKGGFKMGHAPEYGDIVVFRSNMDNEETGKKKLLIKRVIGMGGDTVSISGGVVYRNGVALDEPYTKDGFTNGGMDEVVVPEGTLFLLGDNRLVSLDSRSSQVGFVDEDTLVGKAVFRLFPFSDAGGLYDNLLEDE